MPIWVGVEDTTNYIRRNIGREQVTPFPMHDDQTTERDRRRASCICITYGTSSGWLGFRVSHGWARTAHAFTTNKVVNNDEWTSIFFGA